MQHILVHSKMNGLRPLLTAPPVFAFRQLRGDSKKCCRLLHYKSNYQSCTTLLGGKGEFPWPAQKITGNISSIPFTPFAKSLSATQRLPQQGQGAESRRHPYNGWLGTLAVSPCYQTASQGALDFLFVQVTIALDALLMPLKGRSYYFDSVPLKGSSYSFTLNLSCMIS